MQPVASAFPRDAVQNLRRFTPRTFWLVSLAAAAVLGALVAVPQWLSKQARMDVFRSHVAEIAELAANVVDGDLHRQLLDPANYTPELYERALEPLVRFHSAAPEVFYIYTMKAQDRQSFFVLDTAASSKLVTRHALRPSAYMEPFVPLDEEPDPDYLQRIAAGETYVYPTFQKDDYGIFLSGHTPIHDSQGRYSGFVGVDFDTAYYIAREARFQAISIGTLAAALLIALLIGYLAARYHYAIVHRLREQYDLSIRDELTQLLNRRGALVTVRDALGARASSYAVILVDVDDLKGLNDSHGHAAGDEFLTKVASAMRASVRGTDICARLGGDEFMIFATGCDVDAATEIARRILSHVFSKDSTPGRSHFGVSIGIDVTYEPSEEFIHMYRRADEALYKAKDTGRNRFVVFDATLMTATAAIRVAGGTVER